MLVTIGFWQRWSASRIIALYNCPLAFSFRFIEKLSVPLNPYTVFGDAIHYMLKRFFQVNYQSRDTFIGAWKNFWFGITSGKHGTKGYGTAPIIINFLDPDLDPGRYYARGMRILERFYGENLRHKVSNLIPEVEVSFAFHYNGFTITGRLDRIQPLQSGLKEIWDYKPRTPTKSNIRNDIQMTIYNLAFLYKEGQDPRCLKIYNYSSGEVIEIRPRVQKYYQELGQWLNEAQAYVWGVLHRRLPDRYIVEKFKYFRVEDIEQGIFSPRWFPNSEQCKICPYYKPCEAWRRNHNPLSASERLLLKNKNKIPTPFKDMQIELALKR